MSKENNQLIMPPTEVLIDKWGEVLEAKGKWENILFDAPKVKQKHYEIIAKQLEVLEKVVLESTQAGDIAIYNPVLIPMYRKILPAMIGMEIFGNQPMSGPTGLIFALRAIFGGTSANPVKRANSIILILADAAGATLNGDIAGQASGVGIIRHIEGDALLVQVVSGEFTQGQNVDIGVSTYAAADTTVASVIENEMLFKHVFSNYTGSFTTAAGEILKTDMPETGFTIDSIPVTPKSRKLKAKWTRELEEDLRAVHNLDARTLLSSIATDEIILEMNREMLNLLEAKAILGGVSTWDYDTDPDGRWEVEKYQNLLAKVSRTSRQIAVSSRRGQGNFMVVTPSILTALEMSGKLNTSGVDPMNTTFAGVFNGYIKTYVDMWPTSGNHIIMGYKGTNEVDAGIFYAPYVALKMEEGIGEEDGQPRLFFRTRYGLAENPDGAKNFYRKIVVSNLPA